MMPRLQISRPIAQAPDIGTLSLAAVASSTSSTKGLATLGMMFGTSAVEAALKSSAPWLLGVLTYTVRTIVPIHTEAELFQAHRELLDIRGPAGSHIELFQYLETGLRARIVADSQQHELREMAAGGRA